MEKYVSIILLTILGGFAAIVLLAVIAIARIVFGF